jgi:PTH2 family peptidyl-tRNA hydrolase
MKQVVLVRQDLKLPKGKLAAQVAHAAVEAAFKTDRKKVDQWREGGQKKITLKVPDEKTLRKYLIEANNAGLTTSLITDAGKTCIAPGTTTCLGIGPDEEDLIDDITGDLGML